MAIFNNKKELISANKVQVCGVLKEKKLNYADNNNTIRGSFIIQYGQEPSDCIEINMYINKTKSDGKPNQKQWETATGIMGMTSLPEATEDKPADWISITGNNGFTAKLSMLDRYMSKTDTFSHNARVELGFGTVNKITPNSRPATAEFDFSCFLLEAPEEKIDESTNAPYLEVQCGIVEYNGQAVPLTCVVKDKSLVRGMRRLKKGDTCNFWGVPRVAFIQEKKVKESSLGGQGKVEIVSRAYKEFEITGGDQITTQEPLGFEVFTPEVITKSLAEREVKLEQLKNKMIEKENGTFRQGQGGLGGFGGGGFNQTSQNGFGQAPQDNQGGFGQGAGFGLGMEESPF